MRARTSSLVLDLDVQRRSLPRSNKQLLDLVKKDQHIKMRELSEAVQSGPSVRTVQRLFSTLQKKKQCNVRAKPLLNAEKRLR
jgi:hypothetical protein